MIPLALALSPTQIALLLAWLTLFAWAIAASFPRYERQDAA